MPLPPGIARRQREAVRGDHVRTALFRLGVLGGLTWASHNNGARKEAKASAGIAPTLGGTVTPPAAWPLAMSDGDALISPREQLRHNRSELIGRLAKRIRWRPACAVGLGRRGAGGDRAAVARRRRAAGGSNANAPRNVRAVPSHEVEVAARKAGEIKQQRAA
jgi:hypothetical protein